MMIRIKWLLLMVEVLFATSSRVSSDIRETSAPLTSPQRISHRQLNWDAFNSLIFNAVLNFPDTEMSAGGLTLQVTNLQCTNVKVSDITLASSVPSMQRVVATTTVQGLDMICTARYKFSGLLIVNGSGDLYVESFQNQAITEAVFESVDFSRLPPHDSWIQSCEPTININKLDFSNGGFWGWTLDTLEGMFRGRFEEMAENRLCEELEAMSNENLDGFLDDMQNHLDEYPEDIVIDPLASEKSLRQDQAVAASALFLPTNQLIDWQAPDSYPFGFFMDEAWNDTVVYLSKQVTLPSGEKGLNANLLLHENILEDGVLIMDIDPADQVIYRGHDQWTKTTVRAKQVRVRGLDTLTALDPMVTIGKYTLQSKLSWKALYLEMDMTIDILPSTKPNSYIAGGNADAGISESVTVQFEMEKVEADISVLLALDQEEVEALKVGHFLRKDNILSCFLSSIYQTEVSALTVEAVELQPPQITGFVSQGLDSVISNAVQAGFLMYESSMLKSSKAFFQKAIREVINESLQEQMETLGTEACTLLDLPAPHGIVDVRDLLLEPQISVLLGGMGEERYGDLFYGFVMPTLQKEILEDDNINERVLRPFTLEQSGQEGTILASSGGPLIDFLQEDPNGTSWVALLGWDRFQFQAQDAKVENLDTVMSPVDALNPIGGNMLANSIQTGAEATNGPLKLSMRVAVTGEGRNSDVPGMANDVEVSVGIPSALIAADVLVAMNESSLLHFPLKDLDNEFCWLATLMAGAEYPALNLEKIVTSMSAFTFDVACISCSSPGGIALPGILQTMKDAGLTTTFRPYFEDLLAEVMQSVWENMNLPAMIKDSPRLCPHQADYDAAAAASDSYGWSNGLAAAPQWTDQSVETISAFGFLAAYASLFVLAMNHLLQPDLEIQLQPDKDIALGSVNHSQVPEIDTAGEIRLLDWTNLSATLGPWADDIFDEVRLALKEAATNDSLDASRELVNVLTEVSQTQTKEDKPRRLQADSFVQDHLLNEAGSMDIEFDDLQFEFADISFSLAKARIFGVDSITYLDPFIAVGPQTLLNNIQLQELGVFLDLSVQMDNEIKNMTVGFSFKDVTVELPLVLAMDLDKLGLVQLGSIMKTTQILPCLLEGAHEVYIPKFNVGLGTMEKPTINGTLSPGLLAGVVSISEALFDAYGSDLSVALPGLFDTSIRHTLNTKLDQYVRRVDPTLCGVETGGGYVDFRDLFLPPTTSKSLGGSGKEQYGDLFQTLHEVMKEELTTNDDAPPAFNDLLSSWTAEQSNKSGTLEIPGNLLDTNASISLAGLDATLGIELGDIHFDNLDTLGPPLSLLDPLDANTLNNTATLGKGPDPLKLTARMVLSLSDNKEMQVRNEVNVSVDFYEATAAATLMLKVAEDAFLRFPLKDLTNFYCWLSTIVESTDDSLGIVLTGHALRLQRMDLNVSCLSCTGPHFDELISDLYAPSDGEDATETVLQTLSQILGGEAIQDFLDQVVKESSSKCPHSDDFDPNALLTASEYLQNQAQPFGFTDFTARDQRSSYFNIASGIFAAFLVLAFLIGKLIVWRRNKTWKESLTTPGMSLLQKQKDREKEQDAIIDLYSTSLFRSPHIPRNVRWMVPVVILINIVLYMGGHLGVLSTVDVEVHLAGEDFTIHNFIVFSFIDSTAKTYANGGMEMSICLWIFTGVWPYVKLLSSLFLWFVPPRILSVKTRGKLLLWIDTLTKLSIIDIFTMVLFLAVLLVYIGGPDEAMNADGALYSMRAIVKPGASCYCIVTAQRMSRVSSRFFLDYQDQVVVAAREACARGNITQKSDKMADEKTCQSPSTDFLSQSQESIDTGGLMSAEQDDCNFFDAGDHKLPPEAHELNINLEKENVDDASSVSDEKEPFSYLLRLRFLGKHLGVAFGALAVLVLAIVGCIYAPAVSVEISDLWGLALEAETTFQEAATEYGVFSIVSAVLLKSRFVLDTTWDYVALGFLLTVAFISVGMVFFVGCYNFLKRLIKEGWSILRPNQGLPMLELPSYLSLHAYKHIEIYVVAVVIGCWQLGSVSIYAIHLYCSILDAVYRVLTYIGLAQSSTAQCFEAQMRLPDNLLIFFGALLILLANFCIQSTKQYRKNISEACELLRHEDNDMEHLSSLWNTSSRKGFWSSSRQLSLNRTATFSDFSSTECDSPISGSFETRRSSSSLPLVEELPPRDDGDSLSTISESPSRSDKEDRANVLVGSFSGSPSTGDFKVVASVDQYSTPQ